MKTIGIVLVSLIIVSCASISQRENPVTRAILEKGSVRELGLLEELHYQIIAASALRFAPITLR
jgi:hypothetical protein